MGEIGKKEGWEEGEGSSEDGEGAVAGPGRALEAWARIWQILWQEQERLEAAEKRGEEDVRPGSKKDGEWGRGGTV